MENSINYKQMTEKNEIHIFKLIGWRYQIKKGLEIRRKSKINFKKKVKPEFHKQSIMAEKGKPGKITEVRRLVRI